MNVQTLKAEIAQITGHPILSLQLTRQLDKADKPTEWVSHWDNINRRRVVMHEEILAKLKAEPTFDGIAFKYEMVQPTEVDPDTKELKSPYHRFIVITPKNLEASI